MYSRQPQSQPLLDYTRYYNICSDCPELMAILGGFWIVEEARNPDSQRIRVSDFS